ncbi:MAG: hypothetical protein PHI12_12020 [Dehalococcoidales bacterium]|nr:hypothetical protein [Dehalococcoidales bacterium]
MVRRFVLRKEMMADGGSASVQRVGAAYAFIRTFKDPNFQPAEFYELTKKEATGFLEACLVQDKMKSDTGW